MAERKTERTPLFDIVKGVMMYLVVWGHIIPTGIVSAPTSSGYGLQVFVNAQLGVKMPLFFMISGYFARKAFEQRDVSKVLKRLLGFIWPVLAFGLVIGCYSCLRGGEMSSLLALPVKMVRRLWFIRTLCIVYAICAAIWIVARDMKWRWVLLCVAYLCLIVNPARFGMWFLKDAMHMFPYFVFGLTLLKDHEWYKGLTIPLLCGLAYLLIVFTEGSVRFNGMGFYWVSSYWKDMLFTSHGLLTFFGRTFVGITGSVFILWAVERLAGVIPCLNRLAVLGTTTLGVYVMHEYVLERLSAYRPFPLPSAWRWGAPLVALLIFHFLALLILRFKVAKWAFFGPFLR